MHVDLALQPMPLHEHLRTRARRTPDKPAYLWYGASLSYAQLDRMSDLGARVIISADGLLPIV